MLLGIQVKSASDYQKWNSTWHAAKC